MIVRFLISVSCIETNSDHADTSGKARISANTNERKEQECRDDDVKAVKAVKANGVVQSNESVKNRHGRTTFVKAVIGDPGLTASQFLAQKFANEALRSPKVQETIRKLSNVEPSTNDEHDLQRAYNAQSGIVNLASNIRDAKLNHSHKPARHKRPRKRKRKRHKGRHERLRHRHVRWPGEHPAKEERIASSSIIKRSDAKQKPISTLRNDEILANRENHMKPKSVISAKTKSNRTRQQTEKTFESESMVQRLMRTTTKDPTKKHPGDQGVEYSEYYSDDDVPDDELAATKAQLKIEGTSPLRLARHASNVSSFSKNYNPRHHVQKQQPYSETEIGNSAADAVYDENSLNVPGNYLDAEDYATVLQPVKSRKSRIHVPEIGGTNFYYYPQSYVPVLVEKSDDPDILNAAFDPAIRIPQYVDVQNPSRYINRYDVQELDDNDLQHTQTATTRVDFDLNSNSDTLVASTPSGSLKKIISYLPPAQRTNNRPVERISPANYAGNAPVNSKARHVGNNARRSDLRTIGHGFEKSDARFHDGSSRAVSSLGRGHLKHRPRSRSKVSGSDHSSRSKYESAGGERANSTASANETRKVADEILGRIIDELDELKSDHSKDELKEGLPCKLSGSWVTNQAGVQIDMRVTSHNIAVTLAPLVPTADHQGVINATWNATGSAPFKRGGPFSLFATNNRTKSIAVFLGACRVCQGIDTIEGVWSIVREPTDCRDFPVATGVYNDVFRRTRLSGAKKHKRRSDRRDYTSNGRNATTMCTTESTTTKKGG